MLTDAASADPIMLRVRAVHRAIAELRRGTPILLTGKQSLVIVAAETVGAIGLTEFSSLAGNTAVLLLAPVRARSVLRGPVAQSSETVAVRFPNFPFNPVFLRSLADPTVEQSFPELPIPATAPELASSAVELAKLGRLLPAVLVAPACLDAVGVAERYRLLSVSAADVAAYPSILATSLRRVSEASMPLENTPNARVVAFRGHDAEVENLAIVIGTPQTAQAPLVRIHSECFTGDLLGSMRCDCGAQLYGAIQRIVEEGAGVVLYLAQEGRGIGLINKLRAYTLQDSGLDTFDANQALGWKADERDFLIAAIMLRELGISRVRLLTNNPEKLTALTTHGIEVVGRERHAFLPNGVNDRYLAAKAERFGHLLD